MTEDRFRSGANYRDGDSNLKARQGLYDYKHPNDHLPDIVHDRIAGDPARILDVGCGNGHYLARLREGFPDAEVIGVDLSPAMLEDLPEPTVVADVADLPFDTESSDVVLAMHMLYHVPDIDAALDELQRVLMPDGTLFVSTLACDDKAEYARMWREAAREAIGEDVGDVRAGVLDRFSLDHAQRMLTERFESVRLHDLSGVIDLPEPGPLLASYRSIRSFVELDAEAFEQVMACLEARLDDHFATSGSLKITSRTGILECSGPRTRAA